MAEQKRTFQRPGINRDLDDRLLPDGMYRDALNVNVGRSEGDDVGALENLKGNERIPGQDRVSGQTIGSVRDQDSNTIYWFTTSPVEDAIHEYDADTNEVTTLIREPKAREASLPTCTPDLQARITDPPGSRGVRPPNPDLPPPPVGGCTDPTASNFNPSATFDDGSCTFPVSGCTDPSATNYNPAATVDDGSCMFASTFAVTIQGSLSAQVGTMVTLTATPQNAPGAVTYAWSGGNAVGSNNTVTVTEASATTTTYTVMATSGGQTVSATHTINWSAVPLVPFVFTVNTTDNIANATSTGSAAIMGDVGINSAVSVNSGITLDTGFRWVENSSETTPPPSLTATLSGDTAGLTLAQTGAAAQVTGNVSAAGSATITWSGATTEMIPLPATLFVSIVNAPQTLPIGDNVTVNAAVTGTATGPITYNWNVSNRDSTAFIPGLSNDEFVSLSAGGSTGVATLSVMVTRGGLTAQESVNIIIR